jgi:hypothetical protein
LKLRDHGRQWTAGLLRSVLCYAASRSGSLSAACQALVGAPTYTAVHKALRATLPKLAERQRRVHRALQGDLPRARCRKPQPLAIDLHGIAYHGPYWTDADEVYRSQANNGTRPFHAYATA